MEDERRYQVSGMTCAHCRAAVEAEVEALRGVREVDVDLGHGMVTVRGDRIDDAAVAAAVRRAGYHVRS